MGLMDSARFGQNSSTGAAGVTSQGQGTGMASTLSNPFAVSAGAQYGGGGLGADFHVQAAAVAVGFILAAVIVYTLWVR